MCMWVKRWHTVPVATVSLMMTYDDANANIFLFRTTDTHFIHRKGNERSLEIQFECGKKQASLIPIGYMLEINGCGDKILAPFVSVTRL